MKVCRVITLSEKHFVLKRGRIIKPPANYIYKGICSSELPENTSRDPANDLALTRLGISTNWE